MLETRATGAALKGHRGLAVPEIKVVDIALGRLPPRLDGFSIVQLSDVHIGNTIRRPFVEAMVERTLAAKPDMIVITGDLVDGPLRTLRSDAEPLADLRAKHGVYFVTGNHEYYSGVQDWLPYLGELGVRVLRNERVCIDDGFDLAGVDDYSSGMFRGHGPDLGKATAGRDPDRELILLAHQPKHVHHAKRYGVSLQLSGHTHGGQIWPWHYLVMAQQRGLLAGHSVHDDTQLYVSRGTGYWGPPLRFRSKGEITRLQLRARTGARRSARVT